jgi:hypothetical protein
VTERADLFEDYVRAAVDVPARWGVDDCCAWVRTWIELVTALPVHLPPYSTEAEALALIRASGGLEGIWRFWAAELGFRQQDPASEVPKLGDVALVITETVGPAGGIWGEHAVFAWRADGGVRLLQPRLADIIASWEVP